MGCMKFRQGHSINLGLPKNYDASTQVAPTLHHSATIGDARVGWFMAIIYAITKPFVKVVNNYRGRGQR